MSSVLLDTNIVTDYLLGRVPFYTEANAIVQANRRKRVNCFIAAFTAPTLYYIFRREYMKTLGRSQAEAEALRDVRACLRSFRVCPVTNSELKRALSYAGSDYEDNLQLACAVSAKLDAIISRDQKFIAGVLPILTPAQLLKKLGLLAQLI